jgi:pimeloyl-ACP methyl ester carboxylesterase
MNLKHLAAIMKLPKTIRVLLAASIMFWPGRASQVFAEDAAPATAPTAFSVKVTGSGRPIIFIPGLSCGGDVWDAAVEHFKDKYQCHVLTLAGFAGQPAIKPPFLGHVIADLQKYIADQKLDHPIIIGHSLGALLAYTLAASAPQKVGPVIAVDGLPFLSAIFNPAATAETSKPFAEQYRAMYNSQTPEAFAAANRKALESMITDPKNVDAVEATGMKSDPKTVGEAIYEDMITDLRPRVKLIQSPVLLIGSTQSSTALEAIYRDEVSTIPNHKVVFAPKAKHFVQLDDPQYFYSQVESFLKESETPK